MSDVNKRVQNIEQRLNALETALVELRQKERCEVEGHRFEVVNREPMGKTTEKCKWCGETKTYLAHVCGASGFGLGYGDYCPACEKGKTDG